MTRNASTVTGVSNGVSVIDARSRRLVAQVPTGRWAPSAVAVNPATHLVYVTAATFGAIEDHSAVVVIDGRTNRIVRTISVGPGPKAIAVNPRTNRIYVTGQSGTDSGQALAVIDGVSNTLLATIPIGPFARYYDNPLGLAVNAQTNAVFATNPLEGTLYIVDGARNAIASATAIGNEPTAVAVDETTNRVFVTEARSGAHAVAVVDAATGAIEKAISLDADAQGIAADGTRGVVYVATGDGMLVVVDPRSRKIVENLRTGANPHGVAVNAPDGSVVVANSYDGSVSLFARSAKPLRT